VLLSKYKTWEQDAESNAMDTRGYLRREKRVFSFFNGWRKTYFGQWERKSCSWGLFNTHRIS
jgi:hypothetical protein